MPERPSTAERIDLTILMLGRLIEVPMLTAREFLDRLRSRTRHFLVYAYDDYIQQFGPLSSMAAQVGIRLAQIPCRART